MLALGTRLRGRRGSVTAEYLEYIAGLRKGVRKDDGAHSESLGGRYGLELAYGGDGRKTHISGDEGVGGGFRARWTPH